jgi:hypothetical protein
MGLVIGLGLVGDHIHGLNLEVSWKRSRAVFISSARPRKTGRRLATELNRQRLTPDPELRAQRSSDSLGWTLFFDQCNAAKLWLSRVFGWSASELGDPKWRQTTRIDVAESSLWQPKRRIVIFYPWLRC